MLSSLLSYLESPELLDDPFVRVDSVQFRGDDAEVFLRVMDYHGRETWTHWLVTARGLRDYDMRSPHGELSVLDEQHVLVRQHTDKHQDLSFRGTPSSAEAAIGGLLLAHRDVCGDWIPFDRYLNATCDFRK
jgi:hypothetical protein